LTWIRTAGFCPPEIQVEVELQRDDRAAAGAVGRHLLEAGELPELPLQRGRDGGSHDVRARARVERHDLDRRVIHLREGRNGKLFESDRSRDQDARHDQ
jgi:hypothetical protein